MKQFNLTEFRKNIRAAFDAALKGEVVIVDRYGDEFELKHLPKTHFAPYGESVYAANGVDSIAKYTGVDMGKTDGEITIQIDSTPLTENDFHRLAPIVAPEKNNLLPQADVEKNCPSVRSITTDRKHSVVFDGDDPYTKCIWCGAIFDAITGREI